MGNPCPTRTCIGLAAVIVGIAAPSAAGAQWTVSMRPMRSPLQVGQCTPIEVTAKDANGQVPVRPDGKQVSVWDFDFAVFSSAPDAFGLQNDDATRAFICARAPTAPTATFVAHYPGRQLKPNQIVPGVELQQTVEVAMEGAPTTPGSGDAHAQAQWTVEMRAMQNPLPVGQCTAIEVVPRDAKGSPPLRPDGRQLDWQDFELDFTASVPDAFAWSNVRHRFLCARAPVPSSATVIAHYPGAHLLPGERVPGMDVQESIVVSNLVPQTQLATASAQPAATPDPNAQAAGSAYAGGGSAPAGYGTPPVGGYPAPPQTAAAPPQANTPTPVSAEAQPGIKTVGGVFKQLGTHIKKKAGEVTNQTAQTIADGATEVVDTTLETGSGVVSGAALEATNTARTGIGSVGRSLTPVELRGGESSDNLTTVMAGGGAELRMLRFTGTTDVLEPASRDLIKRLAAALNATQGNFVIEGHVDPLPSPAASQELSEHRAAAVKQALIRDGVVATRLKALGYGATESKPEVPPSGGPPSSARIVVARDPPPTP
jgi:outer membrane protein OmpA-like peptidoglycan-associated protein